MTVKTKVRYERASGAGETLSITADLDLSNVYVPEPPTIEMPPSPLDRLLSGDLFDRDVLLNVDVAWPPEE